MCDLGVCETPNAGKAGQFSDSRVAQEGIPLAVASVKSVVGAIEPDSVRHPNGLDARLLAVYFEMFVDVPGPDASSLPRIFSDIAIPVERAVARPEHAHEYAEGLGVGGPVATVPERIAAQESGRGAKCAARRRLADPSRLIVHRGRLDSSARQELTNCMVSEFRAYPKDVRFQD